jgi:hypothetical protein
VTSLTLRTLATSGFGGSDTYVNYNEIKSALLFGKHMEFVMFTEACEDVDWLPPGDARHLGHKIENFAILNEGIQSKVKPRFTHSSIYVLSIYVLYFLNVLL